MTAHINLKESVDLCRSTDGEFITALNKTALSIIIFGASGDLAKKKTFPALFVLYCFDLLPEHVQIVGYARSKLSDEELVEKIKDPCLKVLEDQEDKFEKFAEKISYHQGEYDSAEDFSKLDEKLKEFEDMSESNRLFYLALPPSAFSDVAHALHKSARSKNGWNRVVVEKPFGHDLESSRKLVASLAEVLDEKEQFRIDHYLGKEMVQNLLVLRFANFAFQPVWNRQSIHSVTITFKEDFGTDGRGGYFDKIGIIRDVMQNHLLQVLSLVAMERPVSLHDDIRDEKVKVLKSIPPIKLENVVLGQYIADKDGKHEAYTDDKTVPEGSNCATYAAAVLFVNNERWEGVPFILKCGKALNERKAEVRIQFKDVPGQLFPETPRNELVVRIQPNESAYLKIQVKAPGLSLGTTQTELELHYPTRFSDIRMPEAYERLLFDVLKGDHSQFVRADELDEAWKIFTPLLHKIESENIEPYKYEYGSRGPVEADDLIHRFGFQRSRGYDWVDPRSRV